MHCDGAPCILLSDESASPPLLSFHASQAAHVLLASRCFSHAACWRAGGRRLNHDLRKLAQQHEQDHLLLEAAFPAIYPVEPFSLRIVTPRCIPYVCACLVFATHVLLLEPAACCPTFSA